MNVAVPMSREDFFAWAERQEEPYEFDGFAPVAMTRSNVGHNRLILNIIVMLHGALDGTTLEVLGPEAGVATIGDAVRYPDVVVTGASVDSQARLVPDPIAVFEVVSPTSVRIDRIVKLREYAAVPSIRHYVIVDSDLIGVTLFTRTAGHAAFEADGVPEDGAVRLPAIGVELAIAAIYRGVFAAT